MLAKCPGAGPLRGSVTIKEKACPVCGKIIELFSCDPFAVCVCGFTAHNETQNCIKWCAYARECVGEEVYNRFMTN